LEIKQKVIISPLNWGLGHAARCIPLINEFLNKNYEVILIGNGKSLAFLTSNFPDLKQYDIGGLEIEISANKRGQTLSIATQIPKFIRSKNLEFEKVSKIIEEEKPHLIISDNRYGVYSEKVKSILLTHQLKPRFPVLKGLFQNQLEKWMLNFDEIWIPDSEKIMLSGRLSDIPSRLSKKVKHIGLLSHFTTAKKTNPENFEGFNLLLSGPEPQRSKLHELILNHEYFMDKNLNIFGNTKSLSKSKKHIEFGVISAIKMRPYLDSDSVVICRSGYSSLMDLSYLGCKIILIPTPGQPEQVYLAKYISRKFNQLYITQRSLTQKRLDIFKNIEPLKFDEELFNEFQKFIKPAS